MRHRKKGRVLGRSSPHRKAMMRNMASSLLLSLRSDDVNESGYEYLSTDTPDAGRNVPKVKGRIITTITKAKEIRPYIEKVITIARNALPSIRAAEKLATKLQKYDSNGKVNEAYKEWRKSDAYVAWNNAQAPALAARRRCVALLGNHQAVDILFDQVAPKFEDRQGGYTRILRLATPRLGDAGTRAIIEFVGNERDRVSEAAQRPAFEGEAAAAE
ncbi:50S ribosomal protein L17 [Blastopirellula sp. JC732]|uniref:Large ribosomal subunit protein bL17 n=1 Tax=Blastopirellula sediminis TaxID=2894196 RepID=A0A9X1SFC2_9BACT|nr:L17 family ribosomal protein [Blastopirellula sediminis]MCC9607687.1 50S ribosomal protein L17 [Blastopirellula sediminis]MCC9629020.1 50S ribosomal protein L17 [Blastopirellula sediminis]